MTGKPPRIEVVAAVIWDGPRFLAVSRPPGKVMAGYWEFPGGKLDPGETPEDALARELEEELGVTPLAFRPWRRVRHDYEHARVDLHFFHVTEFSGVPRPLEGQGMRWVTPEEAPGLDFLPADKELVADLASV